MPLTVAWYGFDDPSYACARLRVLEPARALGDAVRLVPGAMPQGPGHTVRTDILETADLVLVQRYFPGPGTVPVLKAIFASGRPVLYDTDDDWTALGPEHPFAVRLAQCLPHILDTARRAHGVTVSTPVLAAVFRTFNTQVRVVPNFLPDGLWRPVPPPTRPVAAVGLFGTPSHGPDLAPLAPALSELAKTLEGQARFVFFGCPPPPGTFPRATTLAFAPDYAAYAARLPRLGCAVGLAPLADTAFNRAKSPIKWMEYAACGMAGVFADLPPYREVVEPGVTGLLVGPDPAEWREAVFRLVSDAALRRRMAGRAMEAVAASHLLAKGAPLYLDAWTAIAKGGAA